MSLISAFKPASARTSVFRRRSIHRSGHPSDDRSAGDPASETASTTAIYSTSSRLPADDDHASIRPSKHTPRPLRLLRETVVAEGGLLRPFRLLRHDLRNLRRRWVGDWAAFNQIVVASAVYVFFTNLLPGITFASDLFVQTGKNWGTIEVVLSTGVCGLIFAVFSVQPLTILGVTGPFSVLAENIYSLSEESFHIPFLPFMAWSLIHSAWILILLASLNAHDWTMRYVTTFSTEIFSLLNSIIYFNKAIEELQRTHTDLSFAAFLYAILGALGTLLVAVFLSTAESWAPLFPRHLRLGLSEYAAAISIVIFIAIPHIAPELNALDRTDLAVSADAFRPTDPARPVYFFVPFWSEISAGWAAAAILPGAIIAVLFYFDHEVSSIICTIDRYGTRRPGGFAWDIVLLGITTAMCGLLGIPPANGLLPQAPLHSESLMQDIEDRITVVDPETGEEQIEINKTRRVCEQRWSAFIHASAILIFVAPPLQRVLGLTPTSVLAGLFLFMGEQSLSVNPILYRFFYILTPPSELPVLPPSVKSYAAVHAYTFVQISVTAGIFALTLTKAAPAFPLLIIILIPIRLLLMPKIWNRETLRWVDAWACQEGTPEDDQDRKIAEASKAVEQPVENRNTSERQEIGVEGIELDDLRKVDSHGV